MFLGYDSSKLEYNNKKNNKNCDYVFFIFLISIKKFIQYFSWNCQFLLLTKFALI